MFLGLKRTPVNQLPRGGVTKSRPSQMAEKENMMHVEINASGQQVTELEMNYDSDGSDVIFVDSTPALPSTSAPVCTPKVEKPNSPTPNSKPDSNLPPKEIQSSEPPVILFSALSPAISCVVSQKPSPTSPPLEHENALVVDGEFLFHIIILMYLYFNIFV